MLTCGNETSRASGLSQDLPGELPVANAVNNVGQIAGTHVKNGKRQPCIWTQVGTEWLLTDLSTYTTGFHDFQRGRHQR